MYPISRNRSVYALAILVLALAIAVGFRLYKATYTGMVYDETATLCDFGMDYHVALTSYKNPNNNHVINSLLVNFCRLYFVGYEHFFRLHTMVFSILYCLSAAYLAWSLVGNRLLRVLLAILLLSQYCVFDLSYLARGYSIALASLYFGLAGLVFLLRRPVRFGHIWVPILVLIAANVLTLGSMLSAVAIVAALNICYLAFFSHRVLAGTARRLTSLVVQLLAVSACSLALLYGIYRYLWRDILAAKDNFGTVGLIEHLREVLWTGMFASDSAAGYVCYVILLVIAAAGLVYAVRRPWRLSGPQSLILYTMLATVLALFIWRDVLRLSLGFARNSVFLIPLFIMSCAVLADRTVACIHRAAVRRVVLAAACLSLGTMAFVARPSLHAVQVSNWRTQSVCGPLVRYLHSLDGTREWTLAISERTGPLRMSLLYYSCRGYRVAGTGPRFDVTVYSKDDPIASDHWYRPGYFSDFDVRVKLSPDVCRQYHLPDSDFGPLPAPAGSR